jgi:hypothetical protein
VLVLSAAWDLGLERDATRFVALLRRCGVRTGYHVVDGAHHASMCWLDSTYDAAAAWCGGVMAMERAEQQGVQQGQGQGE